MSASLQGTMVQAPDPNQELMAMLAQLSQQSQQAQGQADQAGQQLQQAAQAPMPDISALAAFLPALLGNTASVIGQNPQYAKDAGNAVSGSRERLLEHRKQNLDALATRYKEAAENASRVGNSKMEAEWRAKLEGVNAKNAMLLEKERAANDESQIHLRGVEDRLTQGEKPKPETPQQKLDRENADNTRQILGYYITAGKEPPPAIMQRAVDLGIVPKGTATLPGARKPTALEIKNTLIDKTVNVLPADKWSKMRQLREAPLSAKKSNKNAARVNLRTFDLNYRQAGETAEQFIVRMQSAMDPLNTKKRLYTDAEIATAGKRMFTPEEQQ